MYISAISSNKISASNSLNFASEKINPKDTNPVSYFVNGQNGDRLSVTD